MSDSIADFLTRIRNATEARHRFVDVRFSKIKKAIAKVLLDKHFIDNFLVDEKQTKLRVYLKFAKERQSIISGIRRISKPGARIYITRDEIPVIQRGLGFAVLSTSKGVLDGEKARKEGLGGELLCTVW